MASKGNLRDISLTSLISINCNEMNQARLTIEHEDTTAEIYFDEGNIVHMQYGDIEGEEVIHEVLGWEEGEYKLEKDVPAPKKSVNVNWSGLVLHGVIRMDENLAKSTNGKEKELETMEQELDVTSVLTGTLQSLARTVPGVLGSAVVSIDGFAIASQLPYGVEERKLGAMAAAMLGLGEQTVEEFEHHSLERVFVEGEKGYTIITSAGSDAMLAVIAHKDAKLGLVFLQVSRAAEEIKRVLATEAISPF